MMDGTISLALSMVVAGGGGGVRTSHYLYSAILLPNCHPQLSCSPIFIFPKSLPPPSLKRSGAILTQANMSTGQFI